MRILATADLHYNHGRSRAVADELIDRINEQTGFDVLLVVGDTAAADGPALEECLRRFTFAGPRLFVPGNHELWTTEPDSYQLLRQALPQRVRSAGWHWLPGEPFVADHTGFVGSIGWYDYSYAVESLEIPRRFYEHKVSPGAAEYFEQYAHLAPAADDVPPSARELYARWNDGRFARLHRSDVEFLEELLAEMESQLTQLAEMRRVVVATHHLPFSELLPPRRGGQWDFVRAYLGSDRMGQLIARFPNVSHVVCGHTHFPASARVEHIHAINVGSGYRRKHWVTIDLPG